MNPHPNPNPGCLTLRLTQPRYNVPSLEAASAKSATELAEAYAELADTRQYVAHREHLQHDFLAVLWIPARADGEIGEAVVACTSLVLHAPAAKEVTLEVVQEDAEALLPVLKGRGRYAEGVEGQSTWCVLVWQGLGLIVASWCCVLVQPDA